jgi:ribonuclease HII
MNYLRQMCALKANFKTGIIEAGVDEAGRGCLAGPVFAGAVILPKGWNHPLLDDSKKLTEKKRELLRPIIEKEALAWGVGIVYPEEIDRINILNASFKAMHLALEQLTISPELILVDGNRFNPYPNIEHECIIKGDGKFRNIAAASVLAKTHRDAYMQGLHSKCPDYGWIQNKGYPTKTHRAAIAKHGPTVHHRLSFTLLPIEV